jgi:hypothetical protein
MVKHNHQNYFECNCSRYLNDPYADDMEIINELHNENHHLRKQIGLLRDALDQMDINICAAGDLMTKEDMQEAERLIALRDTVLAATKD